MLHSMKDKKTRPSLYTGCCRLIRRWSGPVWWDPYDAIKLHRTAKNQWEGKL